VSQPEPADGTRGAHGPDVIVSVEDVTKTFTAAEGGELTVLDEVSLQLREGEVVALLGRSGSGKSTLLRCIAGLIAPSSGTVAYRGTPLNGANPGVAMVFQTFALLPWLTVQANVEMGLEAQGVGPSERRRRALEAIDLIGLDGFESAYPKELSGGMRQRVGFARALVVRPDALLMDEPFSALDVLTSENLRRELMTLWSDSGGTTFPTKAILIVTHNIEEAVQMADRILVLSSNPGRVQAEIDNDLPRPRDRRSAEFEALVDQLYLIMTERDGVADGAVNTSTAAEPGTGSPSDTPLPHVSVGGMAGLLEIVDNRGGRDDLPNLAQLLTFEVDDLLPLTDAAELLGLAEVVNADLHLTPIGKAWTEADILTSKSIFATCARDRAPLVRAIVQALETTKDGALNQRLFIDLLGRSFSEEEAQAQLETAIDWGRYGELFDFDALTGELVLTRPEEPPRDEAAVAAGSLGTSDGR
jgi:NitT/TauT family transport system ATP-binding protein